MLCSPEELLQKNQALSNTWQRYQAAPSFESFVELAVSINSFTEFLIDKGITALHHASHQLEQVTLALFNKDVAHPLPQAALDDLNERVLALGRMASTHATAAAGLVERRHDPQQPASHDMRVGQTWLIGHDQTVWADLQAQLGYFGMTRGVHHLGTAPAGQHGHRPPAAARHEQASRSRMERPDPGAAATVFDGSADLSRGALRFRSAAAGPARRVR